MTTSMTTGTLATDYYDNYDDLYLIQIKHYPIIISSGKEFRWS